MNRQIGVQTLTLLLLLLFYYNAIVFPLIYLEFLNVYQEPNLKPSPIGGCQKKKSILKNATLFVIIHPNNELYSLTISSYKSC